MDKLRDTGTSWENMEKDVHEFIKSCATCQTIRLGQGSMYAALKTTATDRPFRRIHMDTLGPLTRDEQGKAYVIVIIDSFTRFIELFTVGNTTAEEAANCLLSFYGRYGAPEELRTDLESQYRAKLME